jgi:hypothetical protein
MNSYLKSFAPWIAYAAGSAIGDWRYGAAAGLATGVVVLVQQQRGHGVELLTAVTTVLFAAVLPIAVANPGAGIHQYMAALSLGTLGAAATASLLVRKPFTLVIARQSTPAELWDNPLFYRVNAVITSVWAVSFVATALVCAALAHQYPDVIPLWVAAQIIGFAIPARFTRTYPDRVRARLLGAAPATA